MDQEPQTIRASELERRASEFAGFLVSQLKGVNDQYPVAKLDPDAYEILEKEFDGRLPGPSPEQFTRIFEQVFFTYMASRYVILPDK